MLQVLAGYPHNGEERGEHVLNCMKALVPNLHEDLVDLWDAVIPKLLSYLTGTCIHVRVHCTIMCTYMYARLSSRPPCYVHVWEGSIVSSLLCACVGMKHCFLPAMCVRGNETFRPHACVSGTETPCVYDYM